MKKEKKKILKKHQVLPTPPPPHFISAWIQIPKKNIEFCFIYSGGDNWNASCCIAPSHSPP